MIDWMFDRLQQDFFGAPMFAGNRTPQMQGAHGELQRLAHMTMRETDQELVLEVELPGIDPKDVQVECREDILTIRGETQRERKEGEDEEAIEYVSFYRRVVLPPDVDIERAEASFKNGLLTLRFPKQQEASNVRRIPVQAEQSSGTGASGSSEGSGGEKSAGKEKEKAA